MGRLMLSMSSFKLNMKILISSLVFFTVLIYVFNFKLIISHDINPPYISRYDLKSARLLIENLCRLYNDPQNPMILGNMCKELCHRRGNYETYQSYKLSGRYEPGLETREGVGKAYEDFKTVLIFEHVRNSSNKFVLKSRKKYFLDVDTHMDFDFNELSIPAQLDFLAENIEGTLKSKFNIQVPNQEWLRLFKKNPQLAFQKLDKYSDKEDLNYYVRLLYWDEYKTYLRALENMDKQLLAKFITNFIVLTGQDEYLFYKIFQSKPGTLKINGTCGHFYRTEYVEILTRKVPRMTLKERKTLASQFLDLIHSLDTAYLAQPTSNGVIESTPIQFCDVKLDNFGLDTDGKLKIIDTDTAYPDSYIFQSRKCSDHDDCGFFDCKSYCDPGKKTCGLFRVNNNLQAFCEKIFNNSGNGVLGGAGSFGSNIHSEIMSRLGKCQAPGLYLDTNIPLAANDSILRSLNIILQHDGV